ncbi:hypothetical protein [Azospirillum endophyticum]
MADSTALDLLKSLATDHSFRRQLQSLDAEGKRILLQRCGFGTLTPSDMRKAGASVFGTRDESAQPIDPTAGMAPMHVAGSASAIETADGRALAPMHVAGSASAIETVDGCTSTFVHIAGSASAIETVDGRVMESLTANWSRISSSSHQKAA